MSKCYDNPDYDDSESDIQNTWNQHPKVEQEHETKVMKNLHILPTDKPSRLACDFDKLILNSRLLSPILYKNQNIYITSDEKLPYDSTIFHTGAFYHRDFGGDVHIINKDTHYPNPNFCKRIILTTDESLFKYGIQSIDDDFLEWIVKNPSCEEVEVEKTAPIRPFGSLYKIIIPKEEPKKNFYCGDEVDYDDKCLEQCDGCVDATGVDYGYLPKEEPKKRVYVMEDGYLIPKEEQKQHIVDIMKSDEELGLYNEENDWEEILFDFIDFYPCILPNELFEWLEKNYETPKKKND